jgi:hypothetical protein
MPSREEKITRLRNDVAFVLYESFTINDRDEIVFESDFNASE